MKALRFHLSTALVLLLIASAALGLCVWYYKWTRFRETRNSPPIHKLANRIIEDARLQHGSEIHFLREGDKVQVSYLLTKGVERQMDLPASCYDALRARFIELCDGGDEIDYARCNAHFPVRLRLELAVNGNSNGFGLIVVGEQTTAKP